MTKGDNYQAKGDIVIIKPENNQKESWPKKLSLWVTIIVAVIGLVVTVVFDIPEKIQKNWKPESFSFYGKVVDEQGKVVPNAFIEIKNTEGNEERIGIGKTNTDGTFNMSVKSKAETTVWVTISKDTKIGFKGYTILNGNKILLFKSQ